MEDYRNIFPSKLPYGPPPKRQLDHEIEMVPGKLRLIKVPTGSAARDGGITETSGAAIGAGMDQAKFKPLRRSRTLRTEERWEMVHVHRLLGFEQNHNQKPVSTAESRRAHRSPARSTLLYEDRPLLWIPSDLSKRV